MKYYIEYKDREEFDKINDYYKIKCAFIDPKRTANNHPPGFIIENNTCIWKLTSNPAPKDAKKITFQEWKEMVHLENKLNPKLEWKEGAYVRYLGTKSGKNSGTDWENYFNNPGLKAGDVGIITNVCEYVQCRVKDKIRPNSNGLFSKNDLQLITKEEYEAGLRGSTTTKTYEFNEGDLVVVTKWCSKTNYFNNYFEPGEIIKLGGQYWTTYTRDSIDSFKNLPFISKKSINGNAFSNQTDTKFRHCTPEEIAYYNKVGLGANINDMKKPFNIDTYVPKGQLVGIPNDIIKVMLQHQVEQGNPEDVTIFENYKNQGKIDGGFDWYKTSNLNIWIDVLNKMDFKSFYKFYEFKNDLPFKIGDEVTILSKPDTWSSMAGGNCGLDKVKYPYTFTVKDIAKLYSGTPNEYIAIFDGTYGWTYYPDIFVKAESKEDNSWKIAVKTDDECKDRPHMIDYLLSLHKYATNDKWDLVGYDANTHYYLTKDNNDSKPYITTNCKLPKGYKVIEETDLPNYPKTETFEVSHDSPLDLKFVVKSSINVLKLLDKVKGYEHHYENYGFTYKYINYPFCNYSHLCDSIPSGYVEISEHEAIDRLTSIINGTFLIRTRPSVHSGVSNSNPNTYSNTTVSTKKQSLTEQLCKIIEKEPDNISVTSLFPTKRKSIINNLKF